MPYYEVSATVCIGVEAMDEERAIEIFDRVLSVAEFDDVKIMNKDAEEMEQA